MGAGPNVKVISLGNLECGSALGAGGPVAQLGVWAWGLVFGCRVRVLGCGFKVLSLGFWYRV